MDGVGRPRRLAATGNVPPYTDGGVGWCGALTPGSTASSVVLRENGASGAVLMTITAPSGGASVPIPGPFSYEGQLHATITGTGAEVVLVI